MTAAAATIVPSADSNKPHPCALGRHGRPDEVAKPIAFLLSDEST